VSPLEFTTFATALLGRLRVDHRAHDLRPDASLFDELGLDSIQAFEMLLVIEEAAELMVPPDELPLIFTLGDAYGYYLKACRAASDQAAY